MSFTYETTMQYYKKKCLHSGLFLFVMEKPYLQVLTLNINVTFCANQTMINSVL